MKLRSVVFALVGSVSLATAGYAAPITVNGTDDVYDVLGQGTLAETVDVTGLTSITFAVSPGKTVSVNHNSGDNYNDADGVGSVQGENNSGTSTLSGISAPTAGYLAGVFEGATLSGSAPAALNFNTIGTSFASLSPELQQVFFIGDGLTGDATGATQIFYVPTGATTLYLGLTDACGYNGSPSCYDDNLGSFSVTPSASGGTSSVPEPATWALMLTGFGLVGVGLRKRTTRLLFA